MQIIWWGSRTKNINSTSIFNNTFLYNYAHIKHSDELVHLPHNTAPKLEVISAFVFIPVLIGIYNIRGVSFIVRIEVTRFSEQILLFMYSIKGIVDITFES